MIIFTDLMTLLLTFFIILVSKSAIDQQSRVRAVESVRKVFGVPDQRFNFDEPNDAKGLSSGAQSSRPEDRLHESRLLLFADNQNVTVRYTEQAVILEISGDMLFDAGSARISLAGQAALERMIPLLMNIRYPATICGHSSPGYSEGARTNLSVERLADSSWALSMERGQAVCRYFSGRGVDEKLLNVESFGSYKPQYDNDSPEGRRRNRRVDIVLDRRNPSAGAIIGRQSGDGGNSDYIFHDFRFNLEFVPPQPGTTQGGAR